MVKVPGYASYLNYVSIIAKNSNQADTHFMTVALYMLAFTTIIRALELSCNRLRYYIANPITSNYFMTVTYPASPLH